MIIVKFSSYAVLKTNVYALALFSPKQQKCFHDVDSTHISTVSLSEFVFSLQSLKIQQPMMMTF